MRNLAEIQMSPKHVLPPPPMFGPEELIYHGKNYIFE